MRFFIGLVLALALGVMGCSDASGTGGTGGDGGIGGDGGDGGAGGLATALLQVTVVSWEPPPHEEMPLEGVTVCQLDVDNCVVTDASGVATLVLPADQETGFTKDKEGYGSWLIATVVSAPGEFRTTIMPTAQHLKDMHEGVMSPYPMTGTGTVSASAGPGATFELVGATGNLWYFSEEWTWRSDLTATTSVGMGGFTEVAPGEVQIRVDKGADQCVPFASDGWPGDDINLIRLPVREGYLTHGQFNCVPLP